MDFLDDLRLREIQGVIIQAQILAVPGEFFAAVVCFVQFARLDHRAHGAIKQQNTLAQERIEFIADLIAVPHRFSNTSIARQRDLFSTLRPRKRMPQNVYLVWMSETGLERR